jgi:hypothetical protein
VGAHTERSAHPDWGWGRRTSIPGRPIVDTGRQRALLFHTTVGVDSQAQLLIGGLPVLPTPLCAGDTRQPGCLGRGAFGSCGEEDKRAPIKTQGVIGFIKPSRGAARAVPSQRKATLLCRVFGRGGGGTGGFLASHDWGVSFPVQMAARLAPTGGAIEWEEASRSSRGWRARSRAVRGDFVEKAAVDERRGADAEDARAREDKDDCDSAQAQAERGCGVSAGIKARRDAGWRSREERGVKLVL